MRNDAAMRDGDRQRSAGPLPRKVDRSGRRAAVVLCGARPRAVLVASWPTVYHPTTRMWAFWKLGRLLAKVERGHGPGRGKKIPTPSESFLGFLKEIKLAWDGARERQRVGEMPKVKPGVWKKRERSAATRVQ